jgi:hypothetical protein
MRFPLQEQAGLRGEQYHYCLELRLLRFVYGHCKSRHKLAQFSEVVNPHQSIVAADCNLLLDRIDPLNHPQVSVENILVVVVFRPDDLVPSLKPTPTEPLDAVLAGANWVQNPLYT